MTVVMWVILVGPVFGGRCGAEALGLGLGLSLGPAYRFALPPGLAAKTTRCLVFDQGRPTSHLHYLYLPSQIELITFRPLQTHLSTTTKYSPTFERSGTRVTIYLCLLIHTVKLDISADWNRRSDIWIKIKNFIQCSKYFIHFYRFQNIVFFLVYVLYIFVCVGWDRWIFMEIENELYR